MWRNNKALPSVQGNGSVFTVLLLSLFLLLPFILKAQETDKTLLQYAGSWNFSSAKTQEIVYGTNNSLPGKNITSVYELQNYIFFENAPIKIDMDVLGETGLINTITSNGTFVGGRFIFVTEDNKKVLNILSSVAGIDYQDIAELSPENLFLAASYQNVQLSGNTLSLQYEYMYKNSNGQLVDGLLTMYFKK